MTPLQKSRLSYQPTLPEILKDVSHLEIKKEKWVEPPSSLMNFFPNTYGQPLLYFEKKKIQKEAPPLKVGVIFSGGQAAGGHNVIGGLFDALKKMNPKSTLRGFYNGPKGFLENRSVEITETLIKNYRNQGGFDLIGSGRDKIETPEQFQAALATVKKHLLDGFVIIGGDDSNTNAAFLAEFFKSNEVPCMVHGVPKTIDGDLKNEFVEISFGFDTATKTYSEFIGNIARDALSQKKTYFFIKLMGRSASHVTLECALQTHPNYILIGEEIAQEQKTLQEITNEMADCIVQRAEQGKNYGVFLIPEGILEFIPESQQLMKELNQILAQEKTLEITKHLSPSSLKCFQKFPVQIQTQLLSERDAHGNIPVSQIESERLLIHTVTEELKRRNKEKKFHAQPLFCGYEGRSAYPTNFDCQYCYALGHVAALLVAAKETGYMCCVHDLYLKAPREWGILGVPLVPLMDLEERKGKVKPVIKKAVVDLDSSAFQQFKKNRETWKLSDDYQYPGPIQFW